MATSRKRRQRQHHARSQRPKKVPGAVIVDPPKKRLDRFFTVLDEVSRTADEGTAGRGEVSQSDLFDMAVFVRGTNLVKAAGGLLEGAHWEVASSAARQLFELLINMEYLLGRPDPDEERLRYAKFGLLQEVRSRLRQLEYERATGRPVDNDRERRLRDLLAGTTFDEFKSKNGRWRPSWSGKNAKELAEASPNPLRVKQYEQLFVTWSEETHAAPAALLEDMFPKELDGWIEREIAGDDKEIGELITMLITLFLVLWQELPGAPEFKWDKSLEWTSTIMEEITSRMA